MNSHQDGPGPARTAPRWVACSLGLLAVSLAGCGWLDIPVASGGVLFQDTFSLENSGWDRYQDNSYTADYSDGGYLIRVSTPNTDAWATPHLNLDDVRIEVDATNVGGPDNNVLGILCRYQDPLNYYFLVMSSDGFSAIGINKDGRRKLLSADTMLPAAAIVPGQAKNHLRADCVGYELTLFINGAKVDEVRAAEWRDGDVGLLTGTYEVPGAEVLFDNFTILEP